MRPALEVKSLCSATSGPVPPIVQHEQEGRAPKSQSRQRRCRRIVRSHLSPPWRAPISPGGKAAVPKQPRIAPSAIQDGLVPNPTLNRAARSGRPTEDSLLLCWTEEDRERASAFTHSDTWRVLRI